ncbi:MAG: hypothetical protein COT91_01010, partial [Candidatus Doudnabacteria bacterium CG10_big_fil_rev_8_21_14_0_10_41_10]
MKNILQLILKYLAKTILWRHKPVVVAVTGSVGKTGTKAAIATVLRQSFFVWENSGNYNNEIGTPLAILGSESPGKNIFLWIKVFIRFLYLLVTPRYPQVLVLEMAADRRGDIKYLTTIARPHIAVVTRISEAHTEFLGDLESVQREKAELVRALPHGGVAILNADDHRVMAMKNLFFGNTISFGLREDAVVRAVDIRTRQEADSNLKNPEQAIGLNFKIKSRGTSRSVFIPGVVGRANVYVLLSAFAVGLKFGLKPDEIVNAFVNFSPPPGRLRPLAGIKHTVIIDDTYNSSPEAAFESLRALTEVKGRRRIAVLGDMLELGEFTESSHRKLGRMVKDLRLDLLFTVGARAKFIADEARKRKFGKTKIREFNSSIEAAVPIQNRLK